MINENKHVVCYFLDLNEKKRKIKSADFITLEPNNIRDTFKTNFFLKNLDI